MRSSVLGEADSDADASTVFDDLETLQIDDNMNDFSNDPDFHLQKDRFWGVARITRRTCMIALAISVLIWLVAVIAYSHGNAARVVTGVFKGPSALTILLSDRNVTLNAYLAKSDNVTFSTLRKGLYLPDFELIRWLEPVQFPESGSPIQDGYYLTQRDNMLLIKQAETPYELVLLSSRNLAYRNSFVHVENIELNPSQRVTNLEAIHLLKSDETIQWRHSSFAVYWLWNPATDVLEPLQPPGYGSDLEIEKLHFAHFSPSGSHIVYGHDHDLYIYVLDLRKHKRITLSGTSSIFNGKPDWVYEEEVYPHDNMVWWSPDSKHLAFASLNDTSVNDYEMQYHVKDAKDLATSFADKRGEQSDDFNQYPKTVKIKYPKPNTPDPRVTVNIYDVDNDVNKVVMDLADNDLGEEFLLYDVRWFGSKLLMFKIADRTSTLQKKKIFDLGTAKTTVVSTQDASGYNGWIEKAQPLELLSNDDDSPYLDRVVVEKKVQLALFDLPHAEMYSKLLGPITYLSPIGYSKYAKTVYGIFGSGQNTTFAAYDFETDAITPIAGKGKYSVAFDATRLHANLKYLGPDQPLQKLVNLAAWKESSLSIGDVKPINELHRLKDLLSRTNLPTRVYSQASAGTGSDKAPVNMIEIFPPKFNSSRSYPLLVHVYGGPGSVIVDQSFVVDFQDVVSSSLNAVILIIDPRSSNTDDWKTKSHATRRLGYWEPRDVTAVTQDYIKKNSFVDPEKTAVWGWSYGGFTTLKTIEFDKGNVFKFGMAVAPVTNWLFYDAVYTERYMKNQLSSPQENSPSRINDFEAFKTVQRFFVAHGTADDNVHILNTLWLFDKFDLHSVENYDMHYFPDSDHLIYFNNANDVIYDKLLAWLARAFSGKFS